jgi:hypothetical protein
MNRNMMTKPSVASAICAVLFAADLAHAQDQSLLGCWVTDRVTNFYTDRLPSRTKSDCVLYFEQDRVSSACNGKQGIALISYSYKIVSTGIYEAIMESNDRRPELIGSKRDYEYEIKNGRLYITTYPQSTKPGPTDQVVRFESTSVFKTTVSKQDCQTFSTKELLDAKVPILHPHQI